MSNLNRHPVRRAAVGVLAGTLAFTGGAIAAGVSPANAVEGFAFERLAGMDRYDTAAEIALNTFPDGANTAVLARGDDFADALAANYLAGVLDAPILLTDSNNLPAATEAALAELGVDNVVIVGGTTAVSTAVQLELANDYTVSRLGGQTRYETAQLIAAEAAETSGGAVGELNGLRTVIVASGQTFADALAAGPIAYAANHPVVLTAPDALPSATADVLTDLDVEQVVIVGGTAAVSAGVEADIEEIVGADAVRLGGQTRYETAALVAATAYELFGFDESHVNMARGDVFADALAGGPHAGEELAPIILTASNELSPATEAFLQEYSDTLTDGHVFGGPDAVSQAVVDAAEEAAQGDAPVSNQTFDVTPDSMVTLTVGTEPTATDDRQYIVSNPIAGATHTIALIPADEVTVSDAGVVTFGDDEGIASAADDLGNVPFAEITVVNGSAVTADIVDVAPVGGQITFTVDGSADGTVIPVVFADANNNNQLDLGADDQPVTAEAFGLGGAINYNPTEAAVGAFTSDATISEVDQAANMAVTSVGLVEYDDNDTFYRVAGEAALEPTADPTAPQNRITLAQFEAELSAGDQFDVATQYFRENAFSSTFVLEDLSPVPPTALSVASRTSTTVTLTATGVESGATVRVYGEVDPADATDATVTMTDTVLASSATDANPNLAGFQIVVPGLTASTVYDMAASQVVSGEESALTAEVEDVATPAVGETVRPTVTDVRLIQDAPTVAFLSDGDVLRFSFSENMADTLGSSNATFFRIADGDSVYQVACADTATCALLDGTDTTVLDDVLQVTLTEAPVFVSGAQNGLDLAANNTLTLVSTAFTDEAGNLLDLTASADVVVNVAPETVAPPTVPGDTNAPTAVSAASSNPNTGSATGTFGNTVGDLLTVIYDEDVIAGANATITVDPDSTVAGDEVAYTCGTNVTCATSGMTLTVTVADIAADDVSIDGTNDQVDGTTGVVDAAGNNADGYPVALN